MGIFILLERVCILPIKFCPCTTLLFYHASGNGATFPVVTKLSRFLTAPPYSVADHTSYFLPSSFRRNNQSELNSKGF
jgi:hypothetical protein